MEVAAPVRAASMAPGMKPARVGEVGIAGTSGRAADLVGFRRLQP
jgi:hypothetical protein